MRRLLLPALLLLAMPAASHASMGPCLPGSKARCHLWMATVTSVNDGDTFDVRIDGDRSRRTYTVRLTGYNSTEETRYSNVPSERPGDATPGGASAPGDTA